jgi:hypothetical protein
MTLVVGYFCAKVLGIRAGAPGETSRTGDPFPGIENWFRIWPTADLPIVSWPPEKHIAGTDLDGFARMFLD